MSQTRVSVWVRVSPCEAVWDWGTRKPANRGQVAFFAAGFVGSDPVLSGEKSTSPRFAVSREIEWLDAGAGISAGVQPQPAATKMAGSGDRDSVRPFQRRTGGRRYPRVPCIFGVASPIYSRCFTPGKGTGTVAGSIQSRSPRGKGDGTGDAPIRSGFLPAKRAQGSWYRLQADSCRSHLSFMAARHRCGISGGCSCRNCEKRRERRTSMLDFSRSSPVFFACRASNDFSSCPSVAC